MNLNDFRFDVDEAMSEAQEERAAEAERSQVIAVWDDIAAQLRKGRGPFAQMLLQFRQDAVTAMSALIYADPNDAVRIAALQADVQRSLRTMEHIDEFASGAKAAAANTERDYAPGDDD